MKIFVNDEGKQLGGKVHTGKQARKFLGIPPGIGQFYHGDEEVATDDELVEGDTFEADPNVLPQSQGL